MKSSSKRQLDRDQTQPPPGCPDILLEASCRIAGTARCVYAMRPLSSFHQLSAKDQGHTPKSRSAATPNMTCTPTTTRQNRSRSDRARIQESIQPLVQHAVTLHVTIQNMLRKTLDHVDRNNWVSRTPRGLSTKIQRTCRPRQDQMRHVEMMAGRPRNPNAIAFTPIS